MSIHDLASLAIVAVGSLTVSIDFLLTNYFLYFGIPLHLVNVNFECQGQNRWHIFTPIMEGWRSISTSDK